LRLDTNANTNANTFVVFNLFVVKVFTLNLIGGKENSHFQDETILQDKTGCENVANGISREFKTFSTE
jgi:hypothetical protein